MKKWIAMLALVCAFCMIPTVSAKASGNPTPPGLYIDDVRCLLHEVKEGDGWNYDGDYTLTLDGTIVDSIYFQPYDENVLMGGMDRYVPTGLRIVLKGKNTVGVIRSDIGKFCTFVISGNGSMEMEQLWNAAYQFRGGDVTVAKYDEAVIRGMEVYPGASVTIGFSSSGGWIADYLDIMLYGGTLNVRNDYGDFRNVGKVNIYNGAKMIVNCPMKVGSASTILTDYHVTDAEGNAVVMEERDYHSISSYLVSAGQKEPANVLVFTRDEQKELPPDTSEQWNFRISEDGTLTKYVGQGFKAVIAEGVVRIDDRTFSALNLKKESGCSQWDG
uniref:hypothetical protein n=1 Tax=uncultured Ligilactobacillus sp. TaxID=2837633 RepID=UPI002729AA2F